MTSQYRVVPRHRKPLWLWALALFTGGLIVGLWPEQAQTPGYRALCEAQGGIVIRTTEGRLCLWAGAVIPVRP
jgi:hypothetical protein